MLLKVGTQCHGEGFELVVRFNIASNSVFPFRINPIAPLCCSALRCQVGYSPKLNLNFLKAGRPRKKTTLFEFSYAVITLGIALMNIIKRFP